MRSSGRTNFADAALLLVALAAAGSGQQTKQAQTPRQSSPQNREEVVHLESTLVNVAVRVTDKRGAEVGGLTSKNFEVEEDGVRQELAFFARQDEPVSLGLILDKSQSIGEGGKLPHVKEAARTILQASNLNNEFCLLAFDDAVKLIDDFTRDRARILASVDALVPDGGTSLYDATLAGLKVARLGHYPRRALVVISDGADQHSSHSFDAVLKAVQSADIQVYFVGFFDRDEQEIFEKSGRTLRLVDGRFADNPRFVLKQLADESGAAVFFPRSAQELRSVASRIADDLRSQYLLGYYTASSRGAESYRRIKVIAHSPDHRELKVRSRLGFRFSPPDPLAEQKAVTMAAERKTRYPGLGILVPSGLSSGRSEKAPDVLEDNFSDPSTGWPEDHRSFYKDGAYHIKEKGTILARGPLFFDFHAEITVELTRGPGEHAAAGLQAWESPGVGMVFRLSKDGYYAFLVATPPGPGKGHFKLIKRAKGSDTELIHWTQNDSILAKNKLGVQCEGKSIELFANQKLLAKVDDMEFISGLVGMILTDDGEAVFDDLSVVPLPGRNREIPEQSWQRPLRREWRRPLWLARNHE